MKDKKKITNNELKKSVWRNREKIVDHLLGNESWENYKSENNAHIPSDKIYKAVKSQIVKDTIEEFDRRDKKYKIYSIIKYSAAACLIICFSWIFYQHQLDKQAEINIETLSNTNLPVPQQDIWLTEVNTDKKIKWITLPDSSKVKLYPSSQVSYPQNFTATNRDIHLIGKAYFKVTEDSNKPFSVWSDHTKTTALGTSFTIDAYKKKRNTTVTLHSGKIVIKSANVESKFDEIYLSNRGEKLILNNATQQLNHIIPSQLNKSKPIEKVPNEVQAPIVKMEKMPLPEVVNLLSSLYKTEIIIEDKSLEHITFTGTVNSSTENLEDALQIICLINSLEWRKSEDGIYYIDKNEKSQKETKN
ncbi:FecR family protein [Sphingobacterium cavernae]|uniref:FecR family protein n=1 Tax=Sphingobacterium cavernae TaxID=2592657 RepID=UPI00166C11B6|nr:FecR family protein [Sphingobacterium cavernae]